MVVTFKSFLPKLEKAIDARTSKVMDELEGLAYDSIVNGSPLTGSPGQPRDLRKPDSWSKTKLSEGERIISSVEPSALSVEDGIAYKKGGQPIKRLKSDIGGFHSVALTAQNGDKLIQEALRKVDGA